MNTALDCRGAVMVALLSATVLLAACSNEPAKPPAMPPASVVVAPAEFKDLSNTRTFTGRIEAIDTVQIRARVQGFLKKRHFEEGAEVEKGSLLFEIEPDSFELAVKEARANVASAEAALILARQTFKRSEELASRNTVSQATLDDARSKQAQAQAILQAREADLQTAELNLSYTKIEAPMQGSVGRAAFSVGNLVGPDSGPLVTLVAQDPVYVRFPVPQWLLLQVRKAGQGPESVFVELALPDGTTYDQRGTIQFVDVQATGATDSVTVRAKLPNPNDLLIDNQLVNVRVIRKVPEQKLVISQSALLLDQQGAYVLAVDGQDKVGIRRITVGEQQGPFIVVETGLEAGDRVIVSGHQKAGPGQKVSPQSAATPVGARATAGAK